MFTTSTYYWIWNERNSKQTPDENLKAVLTNSNIKLFSNIAWNIRSANNMSYQGFFACMFCKGKSPRYQGKYKPGVNRKGVRTCVTTIALCTICLTMFITFFHICMSKDFFEWVIYFMVTIPALCPNSPKLGFLKVFYRCQLTITWMSNIKEGRYKLRLYVSINLLHVAVVWPTSNSDVSCL